MFVPIVRRSVTVQARDVFHFQFHCRNCQLMTWAHVAAAASGSASTLYVSADANLAGQRAYATAQANAQSLFSQAPCPRCGSAGPGQIAQMRDWESKVASRAKLRKQVLIGGLLGSILWSGSCTGLMATSPTMGVGGAIFIGILWLFVAALGNGILYLMMGPPKKPVLLNHVPHGVLFDAPPQATEAVPPPSWQPGYAQA